MSRIRKMLGWLPLILAMPAAAELGGTAATVDADMAHLKAARRIVVAEKYSMHEIQLPSGTTVREYVSPAGLVFAVAWQGPLMPDLRQLLGSRFDAYVSAAKSGRIRRSVVMVEQSDLVVHSKGRMRAFSGVAYLPQSLPADVSPADLR